MSRVWPRSQAQAALSTTTPLAGGATWTSVWVRVDSYASVSVSATADVAGTLYADFSDDAVTVRRAVTLSSGVDGAFGIHGLAPVAEYMRVRVVNGVTIQAEMYVETLLHTSSRAIISRPAQVINDYTDVVTVRQTTDVFLDEASGRHANRSAVQKFGANPSVASGTEEDLWQAGGLYTGWLQAAVAVRIRSGGNAADASAGVGARSVVIEGLDENWETASETVVTAGASASSATSTTFIRVNRAYVQDVGAYGSDNAAAILIETTGGALVAQIGLSATASTGLGQTRMCMYTVPAGKEGYIRRFGAAVEGSKAATVMLWQRRNADVVAAPFTSRRLVFPLIKLTGGKDIIFRSYEGPYPAKTDIWVSAIGPNGGAGVNASFDLVLIDV